MASEQPGGNVCHYNDEAGDFLLNALSVVYSCTSSLMPWERIRERKLGVQCLTLDRSQGQEQAMIRVHDAQEQECMRDGRAALELQVFGWEVGCSDGATWRC